MMDITKSREDFEAYIRKNFQYPTLEMEPEDGPCAGEYADTMREEQFQLWNTAWQSSRESLEVELPEKVFEECEFDRGHNFGIDYCIVSLEEAGIRIKGESE